MATISRLSVDLVANSARFRKDLEAASKDAKKSFGSMMKSAKKATAAFAAVGVAAGTVFIKSAKTYANFTEALQDVKAKTGATTKEINALSLSMRAAAKATKFTATQTAEAGTFLAQAGMNITEINAALRPTLNLAAATKTSVQNTANFMTNIMKGMGMATSDLQRAADVLAVTTAKSNTNLTDLASAMSDAAPTARAFGMSLEQTASLIGAMANAGIKGAKAGISLRATFASLSSAGSLTEKMLAESTGQMTTQTKALRKLGVHTRNAEGKIRNLVDILEDLKAAGGNEEDMIAIFGRRAGSSMMQFMNEGLIGAAQLKQKLDQARFAAERMAATQMDSLNGDLLLFNSQLEELQMIVAENGINDLFRSMTQIATNFMLAIEPMVRFMAPAFDEIALVLMTIGGAVVIGGIVALTSAMAGLAIAMLANPVTWIVLAVAAVVVGIYKVVKNFDMLWFYAKRTFNNIGVGLGNIAHMFAVDFDNMGKQWDRLMLKMDIAFVHFKVNIGVILNDMLSQFEDFVNDAIDLYNLIPGVDDIGPVSLTVDLSAAKAEVAELQAQLAALGKDKGYNYQSFDTTSFVPDTDPEGEGSGGMDDAAGLAAAGLPPELSPETLSNMTTAAEGMRSAFESMVKPISNVFKSIVMGTTSVTDGLKEIGTMILDKVISSFVEMGVSYLVQLALMKAMEMAGIATSVATTIAAGTTMATAMAPAAAMASLASFGANAVPASAGIIATTAVAKGMALGQAHDGIDNVPNTGTYLLESGERVVDKRLNKDMSQFLANQNSSSNNVTNNPTLNFNVNGADADSVEAMLRNNRGQFEGMIREIYNESAQNSPF